MSDDQSPTEHANAELSIEEIGLSEATLKILRVYGISSAGELFRMEDGDILRLKNLGRKKFYDIREAKERHEEKLSSAPIDSQLTKLREELKHQRDWYEEKIKRLILERKLAEDIIHKTKGYLSRRRAAFANANKEMSELQRISSDIDVWRNARNKVRHTKPSD